MKARLLQRVMLQIFICCLFVVTLRAGNSPTNPPPALVGEFKQPRTLAELLALPPDQLEKVDVAVMNLLCAEGLRGAEGINVDELTATLDRWARWVALVTKRNYHRFLENPAYFNNSEGDYRMGMLSATLQQDYGVQYNPKRALSQLRAGPFAEPPEVFFADSKDIFIHGLLAENHFGTCASMPVLFVAVAKRLGYPVHLVSTKGHLFVRYDEGDKHFNVDATSPGYSIHPDEYYKSWPQPVSDQEIKDNHFLQPESAKQMLADFLSSRAVCLLAAGEFEKARDALGEARRLAPEVWFYGAMYDGISTDLAARAKKARWEQLTTELENLDLPEGEAFEHFRDEKINMQFRLSWTGDMEAAEKGLADFKKELAASRIDGIKFVTGRPLDHSTVEMLVLPERVVHTGIDGQKREFFVTGPAELRMFVLEQRVMDKIAEGGQRTRRERGLPDAPWEVVRPSSFNGPAGALRETALRELERELDTMLGQKEIGNSLQAIGMPVPGAGPHKTQAQAALEMMSDPNVMNAMNGRSPFSSPVGGLPGLGGLPPEVQNALGRVGGFGPPRGPNGIPAALSGFSTQPFNAPQAQAPFDFTEEAKKQPDLLPSPPTNSAKTNK